MFLIALLLVCVTWISLLSQLVNNVIALFVGRLPFFNHPRNSQDHPRAPFPFRVDAPCQDYCKSMLVMCLSCTQELSPSGSEQRYDRTVWTGVFCRPVNNVDVDRSIACRITNASCIDYYLRPFIWTTPNPVFKITLFFNAEYLINVLLLFAPQIRSYTPTLCAL